MDQKIETQIKDLVLKNGEPSKVRQNFPVWEPGPQRS